MHINLSKKPIDLQYESTWLQLIESFGSKTDKRLLQAIILFSSYFLTTKSRVWNPNICSSFPRSFDCFRHANSSMEARFITNFLTPFNALSARKPVNNACLHHPINHNIARPHSFINFCSELCHFFLTNCSFLPDKNVFITIAAAGARWTALKQEASGQGGEHGCRVKNNASKAKASLNDKFVFSLQWSRRCIGPTLVFSFFIKFCQKIFFPFMLYLTLNLSSIHHCTWYNVQSIMYWVVWFVCIARLL